MTWPFAFTQLNPTGSVVLWKRIAIFSFSLNSVSCLVPVKFNRNLCLSLESYSGLSFGEGFSPWAPKNQKLRDLNFGVNLRLIGRGMMLS